MTYRYEQLSLGRRIGSGYFSDVHEGTDELHGRVAVKILKPTPGETANQWDRRKELLLREAQNLKAAEHDNVVRVHAIIRADANDRLHMISEFCEQGSLQNDYARGPVSIGTLKPILTDVCDGLQCIHARGMIHRDFKPANLLRSGGRAKIGDFGLVTDEVILGYASAAGYIDHLAPEVHRDSLTSVKTDIWALGMTIYRLLHGEAFYRDEFAGTDRKSAVLAGGFASRLPWLPHVPKSWRKFIRKAMHDDSSMRFPSAFAMAQAMARLPVGPDWECNYSTGVTEWIRNKNGREIYVVRRTISPRKCSWYAESRGGVRNHRLAGVPQPVSPTEAARGLEQFFARSV